MIKFTQADFDALKRDEYGMLRCVSGDWTDVSFGGAECIAFGSGCVLGDDCRIGDSSIFGFKCDIGELSIIGDNCCFARYCKVGCTSHIGSDCLAMCGCEFADGCWFGERCSFDDDCLFGHHCGFDDGCCFQNCKFAQSCYFSNYSTLKGDCTLENGKVRKASFFVIENIGSEHRDAYFYCDGLSGDIFVRAGCWFSRDDAFIERVKLVHGGNQYGVEYLAAVEFARARFAALRKAAPGIENGLVMSELASPGNDAGRCDYVENFRSTNDD